MREERTRVDPTDGMSAMVVGEWAQKKHDMLSAYIGASRAARAKWRHSAYIDLFCGPGRVVEKDSSVFRDGGALAAWKASLLFGNAPFSDLYIGDRDASAVEECSRRLNAAGARVHSFVGPASETVHEILAGLPQGIQLAFLDPFNAAHLDFDIIRTLARRPSIDILVHFSVMDVQRNIDLEAADHGNRLERVAPGWRDAIDFRRLPKSSFVNAFLDYWQELVFEEARMSAARSKPLFVNSNKGPLYRLIMLTRHDLAEKLWNDVGQQDKNQGSLFE